jgi:hypothetical protein
MKRWVCVVGLCVPAALASVLPAAAMGTVQKTAVQGRFRLQLIIGPAEKMSMTATKSGEKMLGGAMAMCKMPAGGMGSMNMGSNACNHHVELHVHTVQGQLISSATVSITVQNMKTHKTVAVPVARMEGVMAGKKDTHFGNNMHLATGTYTVVVKVNDVRHVFKGVKLGG